MGWYRQTLLKQNDQNLTNARLCHSSFYCNQSFHTAINHLFCFPNHKTAAEQWGLTFLSLPQRIFAPQLCNLDFSFFSFHFAVKNSDRQIKQKFSSSVLPPNRSLKIIYCVEFQWNVYSQYSLPVLYIILSMSSSSRVEEWSNERLLVSLFSGFVNSGMHNHTSNLKLHFHILPPSHFLVCSITLSKSAPKSITGFPHSLDRLGWSKPQHNSHAGLGASQVLSSSSAPLLGEN